MKLTPMQRRRDFLMAFLVLLFGATAGAAPPAHAQTAWTTPLADWQTVVKPRSLLLIPVPKEPLWLMNSFAQQDPDFAMLLAKRRAYSALCNELMSVANGWAVYASWVDMENGPKGTERVAPGLASVNREKLASLASHARQYAMKEPRLPDLDAAVSGLVQLVEPVPVIVNEAHAYYNRKDHMDDDFQRGRAYHAELARVVPPLLAARDDVMRLIAASSEQLDVRAIDLIEASHGRKYLWHSRRVLLLGGRLTPFFERQPDKARSEELKAAVAEFATAIRAFDDYRASPGAEHASGGSIDLLPRVREWRSGRGDDRAIWSVVNEYNSMVRQLEPGPDGMESFRSDSGPPPKALPVGGGLIR